MSKFIGAHTVKLVDDNIDDVGTSGNPLHVSVSGAGSGGTSSVDKSAFTAGTSAGTAMMGVVTPTDVPVAADKVALASLATDRSLNVTIVGGSSGNGAASNTGAAVPAQADYQGINVGGTLRGATGFDLDSGGGTQYVQGVSLRVSASGGSAELGTATDPIRTDPTGSTTQPISAASLPLPTGAATAAKQPALGTAGSASADVISIQGIASMTPVHIQGPVASGAAVSGNPIRNGGLGRSTTPTIVDAGDIVDLLLDRLGRTFTVSPICSIANSNASAITTNTTTTCVSAPSAGNHLRIHRLWAQNSSSTGTWCYWCDDTTKKIPFYLAQYQPFSMDLKGGWELSTAVALKLITSTTGANIEWFVEYETLAD